MDVTSALLVRGIIGIVAGILAIMWPGLTLLFLVALFAAYAFIDGVMNVAAGVRRSPGRGVSWGSILEGVVGIVVGVLAFMWPGTAALALVLWVGAWAVITGLFEIVAAIRLRKEITGEWLLMLSGALSVLFGLALFAFPGIGAIGLAMALGVYAVASGALLVALALRMRRLSPVTT